MTRNKKKSIVSSKSAKRRELNGDCSGQERFEELLGEENKILEMVATGRPLQTTLQEICNLADRFSPQSVASVLLVDSAECLRLGAAPRIPPEFLALVDGLKIGPNVGSCGTAAYLKEQVICTDIQNDPRWADYYELATKHGLRAGWSSPIFSSDGKVLGVFGIYWDKPQSPLREHFHLIDQITHLASIAIERERVVKALSASENLARTQAEALTLTLDALAHETDASRAMEHVLKTITALLGAHSCSVWLREQMSGLMVFEFAWEDGVFKTKGETKLSAISPSLAVEAIPTWAEMFQTKSPVVLEDIRIKPEFPWREHLLTLGVITMLAVPMIVSGKGEGLIGIRFTRQRDFTAEEKALAQLLANQAMLTIQLARLSRQSRQTAIVEERNRMAREIHDTLAQSFTGVIAQLEAARGAIAQRKTVRVSDHIDNAGELAREGLREARRSVQALRPLALEEKPLSKALYDLIERMTTGMAMSAKLTLLGEPRKLPSEWETHLLRIGQEALTNAIRHAEARRFDAMLDFGPEQILVRLRDDGRGFDSSKDGKGYGIQGMRERVQGMGGEFLIETAQGRGTTISIMLPSTYNSKAENI